MDVKLFTVEEANGLLPDLIADLKVLQELAKEIESKQRDLKRAKTRHSATGASDGGDPFFEAESMIDFLKMEGELLVGNFSRKGVQLKMIHPGLLDFPAVINGEDVLLCWREGEDRVMHYHTWHDGFQGRKPLG
ncbi:DUF2203 domain-containing protein [Cohnella suwonensis]|uniref:DUF2203 domain-containing protein n=1 Tax=Cohnella suwonensis TaxID=696072 RepID=A0ABW0LZA2_9BACL